MPPTYTVSPGGYGNYGPPPMPAGNAQAAAAANANAAQAAANAAQAAASGWTDRQKQIAGTALGAIGVRDISQGLGMYAQQRRQAAITIRFKPPGFWGGMTGAAGGAIAGALLSPLEPGTGAAVGAMAGQMPRKRRLCRPPSRPG